MAYDPRDHALHGSDIVGGLSLWLLVMLTGYLVPHPFEAAPNRVAQQVSSSWPKAPLCTSTISRGERSV
ncbi:hypothetical protein SAMN02799622_03292 [Methylobacterium sp. UNC378MF]|uniref:hypothetical protein n=1 Tax=Methylobacterium sp. UNC378MF TaxID=1502748 RepID=UPI00088123C0|nr:hypothetical protein [Methylobacterium sp. UNC378MF]SDA24079.1 hypothetical protein SAMN02799622_03292 [Methylobacterium sp. UNC378MF]